jgi:hypothetical protein
MLYSAPTSAVERAVSIFRANGGVLKTHRQRNWGYIRGRSMRFETINVWSGWIVAFTGSLMESRLIIQIS